MTCWTHVHEFAPVRATTNDFSKILVVNFHCVQTSFAAYIKRTRTLLMVFSLFSAFLEYVFKPFSRVLTTYFKDKHKISIEFALFQVLAYTSTLSTRLIYPSSYIPVSNQKVIWSQDTT